MSARMNVTAVPYECQNRAGEAETVRGGEEIEGGGAGAGGEREEDDDADTDDDIFTGALAQRRRARPRATAQPHSLPPRSCQSQPRASHFQAALPCHSRQLPVSHCEPQLPCGF
eukprot:9013695-Pyramimonas_sp.AAC.1